MSFLSSAKKIFLIGFVFIILLVIPFTVYILQQQQQTKSKASPATTLEFVPPTISTNVGKTFSVDILLTPNDNQVSFAKFEITYDGNKLQPTKELSTDEFEGFKLTNQNSLTNQGFTSILDGPNFTAGKITVAVSVGADPTKIIKSATKVARITFLVLPGSEGSTKIEFAKRPATQVLSVATNLDQSLVDSGNVLSSEPAPLNVTIASGASSTPPVSSISPTPTGSSSQPTNKAPVCTALGLDRASTGNAPYSITFTASGNDSDGTISKVTFNFGDSPVQDVTQGGGIGTNSVSVQKSHTYNNAGVYTTAATLTDNAGGVSSTGTCSQTITVNPPVGGSGISSPSGTIAQITATPTPIVTQPLPPTGPGSKIIKIGGVAAILSIIGGLLFFAL